MGDREIIKESIKSRYQPLSQNLLPNAALNSIKQRYHQASILKIQREYSSYKISLDNRRKIYISDSNEFWAKN